MCVLSENVCLVDALSQESTREFVLRKIWLHSAAYGRRLRKEDIEDATQETLFRLWRTSGNIHPARLAAYIGRCARNALTDLLRHEGAAKRGGADRVEFSTVEFVAAGELNAEERLQRRDELEERLDILRKVLTPQTMTILRLVFGSELTGREVASRLGVSVSVVNSAVFRARTKLKVSCGLELGRQRTSCRTRHRAHS